MKFALAFFTIVVKNASMTLSEYLASTGETPTDFGKKIEVSSESVSRYRDGERIPAREVMQRIVRETGGKVTPNDFYGVAEPSDEGAAA